MVDVEADDVAFGVKVDVQAVGHLMCLDAGCGSELYVEAVGVWVVMQFRGWLLLKPRRKNAL